MKPLAEYYSEIAKRCRSKVERYKKYGYRGAMTKKELVNFCINVHTKSTFEMRISLVLAGGFDHKHIMSILKAPVGPSIFSAAAMSDKISIGDLLVLAKIYDRNGPKWRANYARDAINLRFENKMREFLN